MEIERMLLVMLHVGSFVIAAVGIAYADLSLFKGKRVDQALLEWASRLVTWALVGLWVTGLTIIAIDTGFQAEVIASRSKLLAKITVVCLLTLNGYLLHRYFFAQLSQPIEGFKRMVNLSAGLAAVSGASWMYAAFLGMAKPLAKVFTYGDFMTLYATLLLLSLVAVFALVRPRLAQLVRAELMAQRAQEETELSTRRKRRMARSKTRPVGDEAGTASATPTASEGAAA